MRHGSCGVSFGTFLLALRLAAVLAAGGDEADALTLVLESRAEVLPAALLAPPCGLEWGTGGPPDRPPSSLTLRASRRSHPGGRYRRRGTGAMPEQPITTMTLRRVFLSPTAASGRARPLVAGRAAPTTRCRCAN